MRYLFLLPAFLFLFSCKNEKGGAAEAPGQVQAPPADSEPDISPAGKPAHQSSGPGSKPAPAPAPKLPANMSVPDLRNAVRSTIRTGLPSTYPATRNGKDVIINYSFDIEPYGNGKAVWELREKLYDPQTKELLEGGKYLMLWGTVDPQSIGYVYDKGGERIGLRIAAYDNQSFVFHPFSHGRKDEVVTEVIIGWYDRVQDATLARALVAFHTLAENMDKWEEE